MAKGFTVAVITPEAAVWEGEATSVVFPAWDGEVGILTSRAPLLTRLGIGRLKIQGPENQTTHLFIDGGFAQMVENRLTLLTEQAKDPADLDSDVAKADLETARTLDSVSEMAFTKKQRAVESAKKRISMSSS